MPLDVDGRYVSGVWWRHIPHRGRLAYRPDPAPDYRWQHGDVVEGLYLADEQATAWAEWYRALAELGVPPMRQMPRNMWRWEVGTEVADLSTEDRLRRVGLDLPPPTRSSWPPYQEVGDQIYRESWAGVMAPSAARPGTGLILCLFREDITVPGAKPIPPPRVYRYPPVRQRGWPHKRTNVDHRDKMDGMTAPRADHGDTSKSAHHASVFGACSA